TGFLFVFFFQAEDGIRDFHVTGVQTCALPIFRPKVQPSLFLPVVSKPLHPRVLLSLFPPEGSKPLHPRVRLSLFPPVGYEPLHRSEERRVGKEGSTWQGSDQYIHTCVDVSWID